MITQDQVTIIIPHYGANKEQCYALKECLISLKETFGGRILVAKNGPHACTCHRDLRILEQGQGIAVNAAVATTNTPWVFVSNDDMIYAEGWFERLVESVDNAFGQDGKLVKTLCVSPKLVEPRPGAPTFLVEFCGGAGGDFNKQKWLDFTSNYKRETVSNLMSGFNLPFLMKRELWDTIGGYDKNFDPFGSNGDSDIEYKVKLAGIQPFQNQNCIVYHFSQTSGTFEPKNDSYRSRNYAYFKEKWGFDRTDDGIWQASFTIPSKEEGRIFLPEWEGKYL